MSLSPPANTHRKMEENIQPLPPEDYRDGVTTIDADYVRPRFTSSHLLVEKGYPAFIDTGTTRSVPLLLKVLEEKGISCEKVTHVMVTHIHLDHAVGARVRPNAAIPKCRFGGASSRRTAHD